METIQAVATELHQGLGRWTFFFFSKATQLPRGKKGRVKHHGASPSSTVRVRWRSASTTVGTNTQRITEIIKQMTCLSTPWGLRSNALEKKWGYLVNQQFWIEAGDWQKIPATKQKSLPMTCNQASVLLVIWMRYGGLTGFPEWVNSTCKLGSQITVLIHQHDVIFFIWTIIPWYILPISIPRQILSSFFPNSSFSLLKDFTMTHEVQIFSDNKRSWVLFTHLLGLPQLFWQWLGNR